MNYAIYDNDKRSIDLNLPLSIKKGENRYDINLKQTALFQNKKIYTLVIKGSENETYYLKFKYMEQ
jgi:hypothetical protein